MPKFVQPLEPRALLANHPLSDLPQLSSLPGAPANLYLDFNGDVARQWGGFNVPAQGAFSYDADRSTFTDGEIASIKEMWLFVADHFSPFNLNVTTVDPGSADVAHKTLRVVMGANSDWYPGFIEGVAQIGGFNTSNNWVYAFGAGNPRDMGRVAAHEAGHGFGLAHQSYHKPDGSWDEYRSVPGDAQAMMGLMDPATNARFMWWNGPAGSSTTIQDDMAVIAGANNGFGYRADDYGDTPATAQPISLSGAADGITPAAKVDGVLHYHTDQDWFSFDWSGGPLTIFADGPFDSLALDPALELRKADGTVIATVQDRLAGSWVRQANLPAGSYRLGVKAGSHIDLDHSTSYGEAGMYQVRFVRGNAGAALPRYDQPLRITAGGVSTIAYQDYDLGEEGVAYHEIDTKPSLNQRIMEGPDVAYREDFGPVSDGLAGGEWVNYTIDVDSAGSYDVGAVLSLPVQWAPISLRMELDGQPLLASLTPEVREGFIYVPWGTASLPAGRHVLRLRADGGDNLVINVSRFEFRPHGIVPPPPPTQYPFNLSPWAVNSSASTTIEAEDFDYGGEGVAFHDTDATNGFGQWRQYGVDIGWNSGSNEFYVGDTHPGEWIEYTVGVATAGDYDLSFRLGNNGAGGKFHVEIDGVDKTGAIAVPDTGANFALTTISKAGVALTPGTHVLRLAIDAVAGNGLAGNIDWIKVAPSAGNPPPPPVQSPFKGTPLAIASAGTSTIQAEDYDLGGEAVAYHDVEAFNNGGQYRTGEGVDVGATTDAGGGYYVGYVKTGEWLEYTVNVATTGTYDFGIRVASAGANGKFHFEIDGTDKSGLLAVPNTGGWQNWTTVQKTGVALSAGQHVLRLFMDAAGTSGSVGNFNWISATPAAVTPTGQAPFRGSPFSVSSGGATAIEFEDFDAGGEGVAYHDVEKSNLGGAYRTGDGVDIQSTADTGGGFNLSYVKAGEWLEYTIDVATAGSYDFDFRLASAGSNGKFHAEVDGANVTGALVVPNTGGWQNWKTLTKTGVNLSTGQHVLRVFMDAAGSTGSAGNFNKLTIRPGTGQPPPPVSITVQAEDFDSGAEGAAYHDVESTNLGGAYRTTGVDIQSTTDAGGGYNLSYVRAGEWLKYTVNVSTAGVYAFDFRVASAGSNGKFHLEVDGVDVTGQLTVPNTGGWQNWQTVSKPGVSLTAGTHVLRLRMDTNGSTGSVGNFNWLKLTRTS